MLNGLKVKYKMEGAMDTNIPIILKCIPIQDGSPRNKDYVKRHGSEINLEESKAHRLVKKGLVRIIGEYTKETNNKKYKVLPRSTTLLKKVEGKEFNTVSIPVFIPWCDHGRIGKAYNDLMENHVEDWVIFMDHDVLLVNPLWHDICMATIKKVGHQAGMISCFTNRIGCKFQKAPGIDTKSDDIRYHRDFARNLYRKNKGKIKDLTTAPGGRYSGMFILTHKKAWAAAGGFNESTGFFNVDCKYYTSIKNAGYRIYRMDDLYVYHGYFRESLKPYFNKGEE